MADDVESKSQEASEELGGAKKVATKKKVVKKAAPAKAKSRPAKAEAGDENMITLAELAEEADISPSVARAKLRRAELENPGRWQFKKGSSAEKAARKALEL